MAGPAADKTTLYLRGLPSAVVRHAKAEAARRGITLGALVAEALKQLTGPDPEDALRASKTEPGLLAADMAWYDENSGKLLKKYRDQYVAIDGGKVIDHDKDFGSLAERVFEKVGARPILMPLCREGKRIAKLRSPRSVA